METGLLEGWDDGVVRAQQLTAVGLLDGDASEAAATHGIREGSGGRPQQGRVLGRGEQGLAAALDVEHQLAVDEHDDRPGLAPGLVAAPLVGALPAVTGRVDSGVDRPLGPRQGGAVRVGRVARREDDG